MCRKFRGTKFEIHIKNDTGAYTLKLDGQPVEGKVISLFDGKKHVVECLV